MNEYSNRFHGKRSPCHQNNQGVVPNETEAMGDDPTEIEKNLSRGGTRHRTFEASISKDQLRELIVAEELSIAVSDHTSVDVEIE